MAVLFITITIAIILCFLLGGTVGVLAYSLTWMEIVKSFFISVGIVLCVNIAIVLLVKCLPKKWMNPLFKRFKVHAWEQKFYNKLGVRKWKDKIPELGGALEKFSKRKVEDMSSSGYLFMFMQKTVYAEVNHFFSFIFSLLVFAYKPWLFWYVELPIFLASALINVMPVIVQRFNRPKLEIAYIRAKKKEDTIPSNEK